MKKSAILFLASFFLVMTVSVYAQEESQLSGDQVATETQAEEEVSIQDLGVEEPTLLPTSPFYFLKNWGRSINRTFTFNSVKKAELELEIVNEKVAEIKKMESATPNRVDAISKAVENYQANTERLKTRLESLKKTSENPNVDKLLEKLTDRGIKHQQIFDELKGKFEANKELKDKFEKAQERMNETIVKVLEKFEKPEDFGKRIERVLEARRDGGVFKDLRSAEMIDRLNEAGAPQEIRQQLQEMRDNFMDRFENKVGTLNEEERVKVLRPEVLEKLPGDNMRRMQILDEVASRSEDPNIKSRFEGLGEEIIKRQSEKIDVKQEDAQKRISEAEDVIAKVEAKISANMTTERQTPKRDFGDRMKAGLDMARGNLVKAKESFAQGKFGEAFGQATSAIAKAKSILNQLESINRIDSTPARTNMPILPEGNVLPVKPPISISPISPEQIVCTQDVNPVCGKDGKNYSNPCYAKKAGIIIAYSGVCRAGIDKIITPSSNSKLYINLVIHNEEDYLKDLKTGQIAKDFNRADYRDENQFKHFSKAMRELAKIFQKHNAIINFQTDWTFVEGVKKWDKTFFSDLESMGHEIDAHAHETQVKYPDLWDLIKQAGGNPSPVIGGFTPDSNGFWSTRFNQYIDKFKILWGAATFQHKEDIQQPGYAYRPKATNWLEHDPNQKLVYIGGNLGSGPTSSPTKDSGRGLVVEALKNVSADQVNTYSLLDITDYFLADTGTAGIPERFTAPKGDPKNWKTRLDVWDKWLTETANPLVGGNKIEWKKLSEIYSLYIDFDGGLPGNSDVSNISDLNLFKKIEINNAARPEIIVNGDRAYVIYLEPSMTGNTFKVKIFNKDLDQEITSKAIASEASSYGNSTDIRVVSDGQYLYAFYETAGNDKTRLFAAKYALNDSFDRIAYNDSISESTMFKVSKAGDEKLDDPAPMIVGDEVYVMTRYKSTLEKEGETKYKLYKFDKNLVKKSEFDLDLSAYADGEARQSSIIYDNGYYYIAMQTTVGTGNIIETVEWSAPSDIIVVKLDKDWKVIEAKTIASESGYTEAYVTGLKADSNYFYITYNQVILGQEFSSVIKIFDKNWNSVLTEKYKSSASKKGLRPSIEVTSDRIYSGNDEEGTSKADIYIFEKK